MTTEPGHLDKPSRALAALLHDLDTLEDACRRIRQHVADLERVGSSRAVSPEVIPTTRSGWSGSGFPMRIEGEEATEGELWSREGQPLARRIFRDVCRRTERTRVDLVGCEALVMNFLNAGVGVGPRREGEVIAQGELATALESQRKRDKRGEEHPTRMPGQVQPKWSGR